MQTGAVHTVCYISSVHRSQRHQELTDDTTTGPVFIIGGLFCQLAHSHLCLDIFLHCPK